MSNQLLTDAKITYKAMAVLENELTFTKKVNRQYDDQFANKGAKIGDTVNARKPPRYKGRRTATWSPEDSVETSVPVKLTTPYGCDFTFTEQDRTLALDDFADRILKPAVATVANMIDQDGLALYSQIYDHVGTPGTTPATNLLYLQGGARLDDQAVPRDGMRSVCMNPIAQATIVNANLALFNPQKDISKQYQKGLIGSDTLGFDWYMDQNVGVQTIGVYAANVAGNAVTVTTDSTTSTVVTGGWTSGDILNAGDIVTFSTVSYVNPQTRVNTGNLAQFTLQAQAVAGGGGSMTMILDRTPIFSGQNQNVTASAPKIAATAVVKVYGASGTVTPQNLIFHRDAFTFVSADYERSPGAVGQKLISSKELGMSMMFTPFFDGVNFRTNYRLDLLGGWAVLRPELALRVSG